MNVLKTHVVDNYIHTGFAGKALDILEVVTDENGIPTTLNCVYPDGGKTTKAVRDVKADMSTIMAFANSRALPCRQLPPTTAVEFLNAAVSIQEERGKEYDTEDKERSFTKVADAFNAITGKDIKGSEIALMLQIVKDVRQWANPATVHEDSLLDGVAYASLKAEMLMVEAEETKLLQNK